MNNESLRPNIKGSADIDIGPLHFRVTNKNTGQQQPTLDMLRKRRLELQRELRDVNLQIKTME